MGGYQQSGMKKRQGEKSLAVGGNEAESGARHSPLFVKKSGGELNRKRQKVEGGIPRANEKDV